MGIGKSMDKLVAGFLCPFVPSFHWKDKVYNFIIGLVDLNDLKKKNSPCKSLPYIKKVVNI